MTAAGFFTGTREGDVIAGKYEVERVLGVGGMGVVVAARHLQLDERVAIKFLLPEMLDNSQAVARFSREARAAVKIKSEHVARVTDVGQLENGAPYMVMEYLAGEDLAAWLSKRGSLPVDQAASFILHACEALAAAHDLGIVHRDLKPANLFITHRTNGGLSLKVLDFGISKMDADVAMTQTSAVMGSPIYMSPEQLRSSKDVDARADIWSIGVILYELVTGCTPFDGRTVAELVTQVLTTEPAPPTTRRPDVPVEIEAVIFKCLKKDPLDRYQSVEELAVELSPFASPHAAYPTQKNLTVPSAVSVTLSSAASPRSSEPTPLVDAAPTRTSWERAYSTPLSKQSKMIVVATLCVLGVAALVVVGKLLMPTAPLASVPPAQSAPVTSNASIIGSALIPSPAEPLPAPTEMPAKSQISIDRSHANAEHAATKKRSIPGVASAIPKLEAKAVPSVTPSHASHQSHPFDDRK